MKMIAKIKIYLEQITKYWYKLSKREQILVALGLLFLLILIVFFALIKPQLNYQKKLQSQLDNKQRILAQVKLLSPKLTQFRKINQTRKTIKFNDVIKRIIFENNLKNVQLVPVKKSEVKLISSQTNFSNSYKVLIALTKVGLTIQNVEIKLIKSDIVSLSVTISNQTI